MMLMILDSVKRELNKILSNEKNQKHIVVFIFLMVLLAAVFWHAVRTIETSSGAHPDDFYYGKNETDWVTLTGNNDVGKTIEDEDRPTRVDKNKIPEGVAFLEFTLQWEDEPDKNERYRNMPDTFRIEVNTPWGDVNVSSNVSNQRGELGTITLLLNLTDPDHYKDILENDRDESRTGGKYTIDVYCLEAGDQQATLYPVEPHEDDNGNDSTLRVRYKPWIRIPGS